jgi:hypothetical protein
MRRARAELRIMRRSAAKRYSRAIRRDDSMSMGFKKVAYRMYPPRNGALVGTARRISPGAAIVGSKWGRPKRLSKCGRFNSVE